MWFRSKYIQMLWIALMLFFGYLMLRLTVPYFSFRTDVDFLLTKQGILHIPPWRYSFYIHISLSLLVLLSGAIQFSTYLRKRQPQLHRKAGYLYILLIIFFSGPSGMIMALYANGGIAAQASFVLLSLLWITFTAIAWKKAMHKKFVEHRKWMYRSYALTLSAISLRLMLFSIPLLHYFPPRELYIFVSWTSWLLNLGLAELLIRKRSGSLIPLPVR